MSNLSIRYAECRNCGIIDDDELFDDELCPECRDILELQKDLEAAKEEMEDKLHDALVLDDEVDKDFAERDYLDMAQEVAELQLHIARIERQRDRIRENVNG